LRRPRTLTGQSRHLAMQAAVAGSEKTLAAGESKRGVARESRGGNGNRRSIKHWQQERAKEAPAMASKEEAMTATRRLLHRLFGGV
jgi:hypothetical protein